MNLLPIRCILMAVMKRNLAQATMFDFVSKHKRLLQVLLALILIPPFAFFGIQSFDRLAGSSDLASVDGSTISAAEFSRAVEQQRDQLRPRSDGTSTRRCSTPPRRGRSCSTA